MSNFQDELTLFFGTPVVTGVVGYVVAHLTGIVKVLRGGNISVEQIADAAKKVDPKLVEELKGRVEDAEHRARAAVDGFEAEVQKRVADELERAAAYLSARLPNPEAPVKEPEAPPVV